MGKYLFLILIFCINPIYSYSQNVVDLVNPLIGTAIKGEGGTVPFVGPPFAIFYLKPGRIKWEVWRMFTMMSL